MQHDPYQRNTENAVVKIIINQRLLPDIKHMVFDDKLPVKEKSGPYDHRSDVVEDNVCENADLLFITHLDGLYDFQVIDIQRGRICSLRFNSTDLKIVSFRIVL